jgi:hypothetical protein
MKGEAAMDINFCSKCGTRTGPGERHCRTCGAVLPLDEAVGAGGHPAAAKSAPSEGTSGLAIASLVLGIVSLGCGGILLGLPALIMGVIGLKRIKRSGGRIGGEGLAIAGTVIGAVSCAFSLLFLPILLAIAVPNFLEAQIRAKVSRARADMRSLATGIESYYVDNGLYPAWSERSDLNVFHAMIQSRTGNASTRDFPVPSFMTKLESPEIRTITTPVAYVHLLSDPFATVQGVTFAYYATEPDEQGRQGWMLWSPGPDMDYDLKSENIAEFYAGEERPSEGLVRRTYDPTNGTTSDGDIYRNRQ